MSHFQAHFLNLGSFLYQSTLASQPTETKVVMTGSSSSNGVVVQPLKDDETWIEVSNKSNQTPSHWDYDNMISQEKVKGRSNEVVTRMRWQGLNHL